MGALEAAQDDVGGAQVEGDGWGTPGLAFWVIFLKFFAWFG